MEIQEPVRVNVRIPADVNDWLDRESKRTAVPKSSLIYMMIDKYISDKQALQNLAGMPEIFTQLNDLREREQEGQ